MHILIDNDPIVYRQTVTKFIIPLGDHYITKKKFWHCASISIGPLRFWVAKVPDKQRRYSFHIDFNFFMRVKIVYRWKWSRK